MLVRISDLPRREDVAQSFPPPSVAERALRDAGFSRSQAKAILALGYTAAAARRDAATASNPLE